MNSVQTLGEWIDSSKKIVFFGGAGVSTESGIPDFRSVDGLYSQKYDYPPEMILSDTFFYSKTAEFYRFYRDKLLIDNVQPNKAHLALAALEREGRLSAVITQNIDGLHQAAGSVNVLELHGSVHRNYCTACRRFYDMDFIKASHGIPKCECGGIVKPDVVLYGEQLDDSVLRRSVAAIEECDMLIIAGTSLAVYPAAGLISYYSGKRLVIINMSATPADAKADLLINGRVGETLRAAVDMTKNTMPDKAT